MESWVDGVRGGRAAAHLRPRVRIRLVRERRRDDDRGAASGLIAHSEGEERGGETVWDDHTRFVTGWGECRERAASSQRDGWAASGILKKSSKQRKTSSSHGP